MHYIFVYPGDFVIYCMHKKKVIDCFIIQCYYIIQLPYLSFTLWFEAVVEYMGSEALRKHVTSLSATVVYTSSVKSPIKFQKQGTRKSDRKHEVPKILFLHAGM